MSVETEVASRSGAGQDLRVRVAVALGLIALVALSLAFRKEAFVGVAMLAAGMSLWELAAAFARKGLRLPVAPLLVGSIGIVLTAYLAGAEAMLVATILTAGAVVVWRVLDGGGPAALRDAAAGVFAAAYIPFLIGFVMLMLAAPDGVARIIVFLLLPIAVDTGGYFAGTRFGRHPMAPSVSPKKSWEGLAGSVLRATVVGACIRPRALARRGHTAGQRAGGEHPRERRRSNCISQVFSTGSRRSPRRATTGFLRTAATAEGRMPGITTWKSHF